MPRHRFNLVLSLTGGAQHVTILKGVSIGNNCVIEAKSVVTHSISQRCVVAGNPAIIIRKCSDWR